MSDLKVDGIIASTGTNTNLTLQGKGTGKVAIGDGALLFPDADGSADQVIKTDGSGALAFTTLTSGVTRTESTEIATNADTESFTDVPSGTKAIEIMYRGVSYSSGLGIIAITLGDSGGLHTSGYAGGYGKIEGSTASEVASTTYFSCGECATTDNANGRIWLSNPSGEVWLMTTVSYIGQVAMECSAGTVTLDTEVTQWQVQAIGAGTFDAGSIQAWYYT